MIVLGASIWLAVAAGTALLGFWALLAGQSRSVRVSSLRLWREGSASPRRAARRRVDPLWLLVALAALMSALALSDPRWRARSPASAGPPRIDWALHSIGGDRGAVPAAGGGDVAAEYGQVWLRGIDVPESGEPWTLAADGAMLERIDPAALSRGVALPVPLSGDRITLSISKGPARVEQTFARPALAGGRPFALLTATGHGAAVDPALRRLFGMQPEARPEDPSVRPAIVLAHDPELPPQVADIPPGTLLIAGPRTPLAGLTPGELVALEPAEAGMAGTAGGWTPRPAAAGGWVWPAFVSLTDVRVNALRRVELSADWQVLATVGEHPWIALRQAANSAPGRTWVWLASQPAQDTNWPTQASFVVFFGHLADRALGGSSGPVVQWRRESPPPPEHPAPAIEPGAPADRPLAPYLGGGAIALLIAAAGWQLHRARG